MADVVKCSVFLRDGKDFAAMNEVYAEFFGDQESRSTASPISPSSAGVPACVLFRKIKTGKNF
jgi:enamine deaminase RidA (YjgF/YER057c/UK114 family)